MSRLNWKKATDQQRGQQAGETIRGEITTRERLARDRYLFGPFRRKYAGKPQTKAEARKLIEQACATHPIKRIASKPR